MDKVQIIDLLHGQNFRLTQERESLLELFATASSMLTPSQLHDLAQKNNVKIGLTTVYRLLEVLTKVGAATPFLVEGNIFYAFCNREHHHHFVCLSCHHVMDIHDECPSCPSLGIPGSYEIRSHRSDLFGTCPNCMPPGEMRRDH